jgi:hypothetical protein
MDEPETNELRIREESFIKRVAPFFTVMSALIAVTALIYNASLRSRGLNCSYLGGDNIVQVERDAAPGDLQILYQGRKIDALYSLKVVIKNTGSSSIKDSDVKEPLLVTFPKGYSLVDAPTIQTKPSFQFGATIDPQATNTVRISFPLMNGGDEATIDFKAVALGNSPPLLTGRIVDVKQISNLDLSKSHSESRAIPRLNAALIWSLTILNCLLGGLSLFFFAYASKEFIKNRIWMNKWHPKLEEAAKAAIAEKTKSTGAALSVLQAAGVNEVARRNAAIPEKPNGIESWKEYLAFAASFFLLATVFGLTTYALTAGSLF